MSDPALTATELSLCERAEAAWPEFRVDRRAFIDYVRARPAVTELAALNEASVAELYLCAGCHAGIDGAHAAFEQQYFTVVGAAIAHMKLDASTVDEVKQRVRNKLLVRGEGQSAKVDDYAGQGKLAGLVKVATVRIALDLLRAHKREAPAQSFELAQLPTPDNDPALQLIKESYRVEFSAAFEGAVRALSSRERNMLRLHQLNGLTLQQLAEMYDVDRSTVVRWLAKARTSVLKGTRKALQAKLDVGSEELDSLMELVHSRFDVSVERIMQTLDG